MERVIAAAPALLLPANIGFLAAGDGDDAGA